MKRREQLVLYYIQIIVSLETLRISGISTLILRVKIFSDAY